MYETKHIFCHLMRQKTDLGPDTAQSAAVAGC